MTATTRVADSTGNWVDRSAPAWAQPYLRLSRFDRPIGSDEIEAHTSVVSGQVYDLESRVIVNPE